MGSNTIPHPDDGAATNRERIDACIDRLKTIPRYIDAGDEAYAATMVADVRHALHLVQAEMDADEEDGV